MFYKPVIVRELIGTPQEDLIYRFGNMGDPATDWENTERLLKEKDLLDKCFVTTKLQSIENFSGLIKKVQISLDPFNKEHLQITINNTSKILQRFEKLQTVMRIRSCSTYNEELMSLQAFAVEYANTLNLPVLETRVRFKKKDEAIETHELHAEHYKYHKGFLRPKNGLKFLRDVQKHYACDLNGKKCAGCLLCLTLLGFKIIDKKG
jgi:hypothetical protein